MVLQTVGSFYTEIDFYYFIALKVLIDLEIKKNFILVTFVRSKTFSYFDSNIDCNIDLDVHAGQSFMP